MSKKKTNEMLCTNVNGASRILNRTRQTVTTHIKKGNLDGFSYGRQTLVPMKDIARELGVTPSQVARAAKALGLPLWRCDKK